MIRFLQKLAVHILNKKRQFFADFLAQMFQKSLHRSLVGVFYCTYVVTLDSQCHTYIWRDIHQNNLESLISCHYVAIEI
jgi:hypothetical protein